jgi:transcriptional regulator with XRE-family HTH domain
MKSDGLWKRLQRVAYRRAFVAANVGVQIAAQLLALRTAHGKSQEKVAEEIGMNQARISLMEKPDYQKYNIQTLMRFAKYYDVALDVRFVPIRNYVTAILNRTPGDMAPASFDEPVALPAIALISDKPVQEIQVPQEPSRLDSLVPRMKTPTVDSQASTDFVDPYAE